MPCPASRWPSTPTSTAGLIDEKEARKRRAEVAEEADFFGSMDGASKFVRGDAMAGLLILFITIVGGFAIGMARTT
jgi:flagellar biosynthesis protein FlhA